MKHNKSEHRCVTQFNAVSTCVECSPWPYLRCCCCLCPSCGGSLLCYDLEPGCRGCFFGSSLQLLGDYLKTKQRGKKWHSCSVFIQMIQCKSAFKTYFTFIKPVLLNYVVLHLCCHLLWYLRRVGWLFPAVHVHRLCHSPATSCFIHDAGLN